GLGCGPGVPRAGHRGGGRRVRPPAGGDGVSGAGGGAARRGGDARGARAAGGAGSDRNGTDRARIVIVDVSPMMRQLIREIVETTGRWNVVGEAGTGFEAIRLLHTEKPDVLTLDLEMPALGGGETLGYIRSELPPPVVL